jgi:transposase
MLRQQRESGDLAPRPRGGGRRPSLSPQQRRLLRRHVEREQDISLAELQTSLREAAQVAAHVSTISRALKALDLPRKKKD